MSFTVMSQNIPRRVSQTKLRNYLKGPFQRPSEDAPPTSLAVFQEFTHGLEDFHDILPHWEIQWVIPPQPVAWNKGMWECVDAVIEKVYDEQYVGQPGAGPKVLSERHVQFFQLERKSKRKPTLWMGNIHAAPSLRIPKQPRADYSRDELHEMLMTANAEFVSDTDEPVILAGDYNAEYNHPNLDPLRNQGMLMCTQKGQGTHGRPPNMHQIDLILMRPGRNRRPSLTRMSTGRLPKVVDHHPVWSELQFRHHR